MVKIDDFNSYKELNEYFYFLIGKKREIDKYLEIEKRKINASYERRKEHEYINLLFGNSCLSKREMQKRINILTTDNDYNQYIFDLGNSELFADSESLDYDINTTGSMLRKISSLRAKTNGEWTCILHEILKGQYYLSFYTMGLDNVFVFYVKRGTSINNISINDLINHEKDGSAIFYERLNCMPDSLDEYFSRKKTMGIIPCINDQINEVLFNEYKQNILDSKKRKHIK